jgi:RNA polymerase sigma-70 factor (ECF subfamily)
MTFSGQEREEFKALVIPLLDELHGLAVRLCGDQCNAEDLVAETIIKACENFHRFRDRSKIKPWLFRILSNAFITRCRARKRHQTIEYTEVDSPENELEQDEKHFSLFNEISQPFLLWWANPERALIDKLLDEDIKQAIEELPEEFRLAVVLCDVEGLSYQEISHILSVPIGTVRSRLARGRSMLQKKLWHHAEEMGILTRKKDDHEKGKKATQEHQL